jgi:hypothetical protein
MPPRRVRIRLDLGSPMFPEGIPVEDMEIIEQDRMTALLPAMRISARISRLDGDREDNGYDYVLLPVLDQVEIRPVDPPPPSRPAPEPETIHLEMP